MDPRPGQGANFHDASRTGWAIGAIRTLFRGTTIFTLMRWMAHERITPASMPLIRSRVPSSEDRRH